MQKATQAYLQTQVTTTTQGDLLILLYDAALKFLSRAKEFMAAKDYAQKGIFISKALDIIAELQSSLNPQAGGDIAGNLSKIYFMCSTKLLTANMNMDPKLVDEVMKMLTGIRDAFAQINTPEFVPQKQPPAQSMRNTGPVLSPTAVAAPSAGAPAHKAFAAYNQAAAKVSPQG